MYCIVKSISQDDLEAQKDSNRGRSNKRVGFGAPLPQERTPHTPLVLRPQTQLLLRWWAFDVSQVLKVNSNF